MFTGIVAGRAEVRQVSDRGGVRRLSVRFPEGATDGITIGASVALAGVCLTVVQAEADTLHFDCIDETLAKTTIGRWQAPLQVNFERAARIGDEIGGHLLSGHVMGTARAVDRREVEGNLSLALQIPSALQRYVFSKGYIGVDGASLTIGDVDTVQHTFRVHLIPETRRVTTLGGILPGDLVNIEVDAATQATVDTVERILASRIA